MALTFTKVNADVVGPRRRHTYDITFDSSYPTGGEAVTAGDFGLSTLDDVEPRQVSNRVVTYDATNKKLLLYTALGTEAANASDQSAIVARVDALGR